MIWVEVSAGARKEEQYFSVDTKTKKARRSFSEGGRRWSRRESNPRPGKQSICFLHA
jgi:hypothetical protein